MYVASYYIYSRSEQEPMRAEVSDSWNLCVCVCVCECIYV